MYINRKHTLVATTVLKQDVMLAESPSGGDRRSTCHNTAGKHDGRSVVRWGGGAA